MSLGLSGDWARLRGALDPDRFERLLQANVAKANAQAAQLTVDDIRAGLVAQRGMEGAGSEGPGKLHPFTVHRRNTRKLDSAARAGDRKARALQSRQPKPGRGVRPPRPYNLSRSPHKRLIDHGNAGLLGAITHAKAGWSKVVIGVNRKARYTSAEGGELVANIAEIQENGRRITVTPKMRRWLHAKGLHLKPSTTRIEIPGQHFMARGLQAAHVRFKERWRAAVEATVRGRRL